MAQRRALQSKQRDLARALYGSDAAGRTHANWEIERLEDKLVLRRRPAAVKDGARARVLGALGFCGFLVFIVAIVAAIWRWPFQTLLVTGLLLLVVALGLTIPFLVYEAWRGRTVTVVFDRLQDAIYRNGTRFETLSRLQGVGIRKHQSKDLAWYILGVRFPRGMSLVKWLDIERGEKSALIPLGETIAIFVGGRLEVSDE